MTIYPPEILDAIFDKVDNVRDLCHARMANRALCAAATPFAFRCFRALSVHPNSTSARYIGRLFDQPNIAFHIREVSYHGTVPYESGSLPNYGVFFPSHLIEDFRVTTCLCESVVAGDVS